MFFIALAMLSGVWRNAVSFECGLEMECSLDRVGHGQSSYLAFELSHLNKICFDQTFTIVTIEAEYQGNVHARIQQIRY